MTVRNVIILKSWEQDQLARPSRNLRTQHFNRESDFYFYKDVHAFRQIGLEARSTQARDQLNSPGSQKNQEKGLLNRSGSLNNKLNVDAGLDANLNNTDIRL